MSAEAALTIGEGDMCLANAYIIRRGESELIMKNVKSVRAVEKDVWDLSGLFGEKKQITARMKRMLLLENRLFFEELP